MSLNCGIVGLPNVGKSTLFNALTSTQKAQAANYPFCTIEPNKGIVNVVDERLDTLAKINKSVSVLPAKLEFIDIAGLVKNANKGEGLGNQFLANIREVDAIIHVLRCFENTDIIHVEGSVDPIRDAEIVNTELMIADLNSLEIRMANLEKKAKGNDKISKEMLEVAKPILEALRQGLPARSVSFKTIEEKKAVKLLQLLTDKPVLYVCNVNEEDLKNGNAFSEKVKAMAKLENASCVLITAQIEQEISMISDEQEKKEYLNAMGLEETGLNKIIKEAYNLLSLQTYFTSGPKETRAWTIKKGTFAPAAAGEIHSDFERGFICAEVVSYNDFVECGGEQKAKEKAKLRQEGKSYVVQDGDVILFRFNV